MSGRHLDRRELIVSASAGLVVSACTSPRPAVPIAAPAADTGRALLVLEMFGGNDGLSTLVPHQDDAYHRARPTLRLDRAATLAVTSERGLHPSLENLHRLYHAGYVAAIEGVGMPSPSYSHFRAQEIWHTARPEGRTSGPGWLARVREGAWGADDDPMLMIHVGGDRPYSLWSERHPAVSIRVASELEWIGSETQREAFARAAEGVCTETEPTRRDRLLEEVRSQLRESQVAAARLRRIFDGYRPRAVYPAEPFAAALRAVAALLNSDLRARVYSVVLSNFDTHGAVQQAKHARLLAQLDRGLGAFFADLRGTVADGRILVLAFSEFGRRVEENISHGTDHGAAGPAFLMGECVRGGLHGLHPSLTELDANGNLVQTTDFRRLYATCLESWLGVESHDVLGGRYEPMPVLRG